MRADKAYTALFTATTLALACTPLLGMRPAVFIIGAWVLSALAHRLFAGSIRPPADIRTFLFLAAPFLLMVLDIARASDAAVAWSIAERSAFLAIAPFVVFMLRPPVNDALRARAVDVYGIAALALAAIGNLGMLALDMSGPEPFEHRYRAAFSRITDLHPPFAAYFLFSAALFQLERLLREDRHRWVRGMATMVLVLAGFLLASRTPIVAFVLIALTLVGARLPWRTAWRSGAALVLVAVIGAAVLPSTRERFSEAWRTGPAFPTATTANSVNLRSAITQCSTDLLREHWMTGMGQAAVQPALDACYAHFDLADLANGSYSTHNQALHWWLSFGLAGPLLFVAFFAVTMQAAFRAGELRLVLFLCFFLICCFTENVLARQWGVVPFAFFVALLAPPLFAGSRSERERSQR